MAESIGSVLAEKLRCAPDYFVPNRRKIEFSTENSGLYTYSTQFSTLKCAFALSKHCVNCYNERKS